MKMMNWLHITDYSAVTRNAFDNLRLSNVEALLDVLTSSRVATLAHLKRVYSESAEGFSEAAAFLSRIRIVKESDGQLLLRAVWKSRDKDYRRQTILGSLLRARNRYRSEIFRFLGGFEVLESDIVYFSSAQVRSRESAVRNFLIEMGIVKHVIGEQKYLLEPEYANIYARAMDKAHYSAPSTLTRHLVAKGEIGLAAEEEILAFERDRVGGSYCNRTKHVSRRNVAAGYDIRSVTVCEGGKILPRFIEVKAVPSNSYRFFWSRNEVDVARSLAHWYHLYLLPVDRKGCFDMSGLKIISNPCKVLFADETDWICETNAMACYLDPAVS